MGGEETGYHLLNYINRNDAGRISKRGSFSAYACNVCPDYTVAIHLDPNVHSSDKAYHITSSIQPARQIFLLKVPGSPFLPMSLRDVL